MIKTCKICNKEFETPYNKVECCSTECSNKAKSKIYALLKDFKTFGEIPPDTLKAVRQWGRNHFLKALRLHLPHLYEEFKEHWDNYKICKYCGDFFKRSKTGARALEACPKPGCKKSYLTEITGISSNRKKTCVDKYGVDSYSKTEAFKKIMVEKNPFYDALKQREYHTILISNAGGIEAWKERQRKNSANYQQSLSQEEKLRQAEKRENTTLERHGVRNVFDKGYSISKGETKFLDELENILGIKIERQRRIERTKVDGFIPPEKFENTTIVEDYKIPQNSKGLIIEYLGDYWHGKSNDNALNKKCNKTAKQLYAETQERFKCLHKAGYSIIYQWESDYLSEGFKPKIFSQMQK